MWIYLVLKLNNLWYQSVNMPFEGKFETDDFWNYDNILNIKIYAFSFFMLNYLLYPYCVFTLLSGICFGGWGTFFHCLRTLLHAPTLKKESGFGHIDLSLFIKTYYIKHISTAIWARVTQRYRNIQHIMPKICTRSFLL